MSREWDTAQLFRWPVNHLALDGTASGKREVRSAKLQPVAAEIGDFSRGIYRVVPHS